LITDLYDNDNEIIANGQTIVYTLHQSIGHLGIFVSGKVATREHQEFANAMDLIDLAPPGLYEAVITDVGENTNNPELIHGRYLFRMEQRSLDDIRALGNNDAADQLRFATAARVSEANLAVYRSTIAPFVRAAATTQSAETMRRLHPARLQFSAFSDENPLMQPVKMLAEAIRADRRPVAADNPLLAIERMTSEWIVACLDAAGAARGAMQEQIFLTTYGSPLLQALMGFGPDAAETLKQVDRDLMRETNQARLRADLESQFEVGGLGAAIIRALLYVRLPERSIDERGFTVAKAIRDARPAGLRLSQAALKEMFREQFLLLVMDQDRAVRALSGLLPTDPATRQAALADIRRVVAASGRISEEGTRRLAEVEAIFDNGAAIESASQTSTKESATPAAVGTDPAAGEPEVTNA
jgi:hypothetical protein